MGRACPFTWGLASWRIPFPRASMPRPWRRPGPCWRRWACLSRRRRHSMPRLVEPWTAPLPEDGLSNGCFETMRAYRGRIFRLDPHLDRLYASIADLGVRAPERRGLADQLVDTLARSRLREAVVRVALRPRPPAARPFDPAQG